MKYLSQIRAGQGAPQTLEALYGASLKGNDAAEFRDDMEAAYAAAPESVLLAAWHYRFAHAAADAGERRPINWALAIPLSLLTGLVLWWLSGNQFVFQDTPHSNAPYLFVLITPVIALIALAFFAVTRKQGYSLPTALGVGLAVVTAYAMWLSVKDINYRQIASAHLPLLSWAAAGVCLMGVRAGAKNRFAFLAKSVEVTVVTGVYAMAAVAFAGITMQMFQTLGITVSESVNRLLFLGGAGLMPMIAVASVYDPASPPEAQEFRRGLSKMVTTLPRLMLALTLVVLVVYIAFIPANFMQPFRDRNVLITYNMMLFAVFGLLVGATPVSADDLSESYQTWLRRGIVAVAALVVLVSVYALAAIVYRTVQDRLTINRLTIIGWNAINIGLLGLLLYRQGKGGKARWIESLHSTFSVASVAYFGWAAFVTLATAWLF
ncbi:MAG: hypothetical protein HY679_10170 [Chloroflexi bacterium]|nr:hypothetical protein [Chloroflexota bacterium]